MSDRKPWLAFILSMLAPGLGHLYAGFVKQAFLAPLVLAALTAVTLWGFASPRGGALKVAATTLVLPLASIAIASHAASIARRGRRLDVNRWLRLAIYVAFLIGLGQVWSRATDFVRSDVVESFYIPTPGMFPTIYAGDYLIVDKRAYVDALPQRGDVVIIWLVQDERKRAFAADVRPELPRTRFVERIIGIPGDRVRVTKDAVYLNGSALPASSVGKTDAAGGPLELFAQTLDGHAFTIARDVAAQRREFPEVTVPPDRYFLLGDNRDNSNDSRYWGTVHRSDIIARASYLYFSRRPDTIDIRWSRIGAPVQ